MGKHNETGIKGEQIAGNFLLNKGYKILHNNWRFERKEVDIIAEKDDLLVFVEVKTRSRTDFGFPEDAVNKRKQQFLKIAADAFMDSNKGYVKLQFDVVSILVDKQGTVAELLHIEDAFY
jgi:putative endonuclease